MVRRAYGMIVCEAVVLFVAVVVVIVLGQMAKVVRTFPGQSGIVYCLSRKDCEKVRVAEWSPPVETSQLWLVPRHESCLTR